MDSKARTEDVPDKFKFNLEIPKLDSDIPRNKIDVVIKREPRKSTKDYLEILEKLRLILTNSSLTNVQQADFCKSQRYFMKLYLEEVKKS